MWFQLYDIPILIFLTFHFSEFSKFNTMIIYNLCNSKSESNVFSVTILFYTLWGEFPSRVWASWNLHYHLHLHGSFLCCRIRSDNMVQISSPHRAAHFFFLGQYPMIFQRCFWDWVTILEYSDLSCTKDPKGHFFLIERLILFAISSKPCRPQACFSI